MSDAGLKKNCENFVFAVDAQASVRYFVCPTGSGTPLIWSAFYVHFGTANWAQFCPGNENGNVIFVGMRLSFFVV